MIYLHLVSGCLYVQRSKKLGLMLVQERETESSLEHIRLVPGQACLAPHLQEPLLTPLLPGEHTAALSHEPAPHVLVLRDLSLTSESKLWRRITSL